MYVELTAYQLLTLETKVLGIAFAGGGVETAAVVVAIVRRREAAARRGRGSDCMMTKKSGLRCERPFTAPTGPASAAATWMPSLTRPSSLGQRRSEVPKSILRYTLSRKSTGIKTAFKQTGHIQIDCITNLQTTCSPMCRSKLQTRGVNHNLIAIVSFATSYAFIAATAGQLVATGRAQLGVANANSAGILQEVLFQAVLWVAADRGLEPTRDECDHEAPSGGGVGITWPVCRVPRVPRDESEKAVGVYGRRFASPAYATGDTPDSVVICVSPSSPSSEGV